MRPATASLVMGWVGQLTEFLQAGLLVLQPEGARLSQVIGISSPRISIARCTREPAATAARAERRRFASSRLASRLAVARTSSACASSSQARTGVVRAQPGEHGADGVAVSDDDTVDPLDLTGLGRDPEPSGGADQGE